MGRFSPLGHGQLGTAGPRAGGQEIDAAKEKFFGGPPSTQGVSGGSSRANNTSGQLPVAEEQTFALMAPPVACTPRPVGTSA